MSKYFGCAENPGSPVGEGRYQSGLPTGREGPCGIRLDLKVSGCTPIRLDETCMYTHIHARYAHMLSVH